MNIIYFHWQRSSKQSTFALDCLVIQHAHIEIKRGELYGWINWNFPIALSLGMVWFCLHFSKSYCVYPITFTLFRASQLSAAQILLMLMFINFTDLFEQKKILFDYETKVHCCVSKNELNMSQKKTRNELFHVVNQIMTQRLVEPNLELGRVCCN